MTLTKTSAIALASAFAIASPAMAWTHHHRAQQASAEQQETAQLNEQQLSNPGTTAAPDMGATGGNERTMRDNDRATPAADTNNSSLGDPSTNGSDANHSSHRAMPTDGASPH